MLSRPPVSHHTEFRCISPTPWSSPAVLDQVPVTGLLESRYEHVILADLSDHEMNYFTRVSSPGGIHCAFILNPTDNLHYLFP